MSRKCDGMAPFIGFIPIAEPRISYKIQCNIYSSSQKMLNRRHLLKASATAATAALGSLSAAQESNPPSINIQPLSSELGLRIASFHVLSRSEYRLGVITDSSAVIDIGKQAQHQKLKLVFDPSSMLSLLHAGDQALAQVAQLVHHAKSADWLLNQIQLTSPIPHPQSNIYAVGWNYLDHFEEGKNARADKTVKEYPQVPVFFSKGTQTMNGPFDAIPYDASYSTMIDWEAELAVVIGRQGKNIAESEAMKHVFGYAAYNDTTARDIQQKRHSGQWFKGKSLDGHGPMGPWIVTSAGVDLNQVRVICRVNGIEKQNASYQQMYFKIPTIIAELSKGMTLMPGDIIATGTPSGVGFGRVPQEFLKPGDLIETEIVGVGVIRNRMQS